MGLKDYKSKEYIQGLLANGKGGPFTGDNFKKFPTYKELKDYGICDNESLKQYFDDKNIAEEDKRFVPITYIKYGSSQPIIVATEIGCQGIRVIKGGNFNEGLPKVTQKALYVNGGENNPEYFPNINGVKWYKAWEISNIRYGDNITIAPSMNKSSNGLQIVGQGQSEYEIYNCTLVDNHLDNGYIVKNTDGKLFTMYDKDHGNSLTINVGDASINSVTVDMTLNCDEWYPNSNDTVPTEISGKHKLTYNTNTQKQIKITNIPFISKINLSGTTNDTMKEVIKELVTFDSQRKDEVIELGVKSKIRGKINWTLDLSSINNGNTTTVFKATINLKSGNFTNNNTYFGSNSVSSNAWETVVQGWYDISCDPGTTLVVQITYEANDSTQSLSKGVSCITNDDDNKIDLTGSDKSTTPPNGLIDKGTSKVVHTITMVPQKNNFEYTINF